MSEENDLEAIIGALNFEVVGEGAAPSAAEAINNAMVKMDFLVALSKDASPGVRKAVTDMLRHWTGFYRTGAYWTIPEPILYPKLKSYAQWYERAYALVSQSIQRRLPLPASVFPTFAQTVDNSVARAVDANEEVAERFKQTAKEAAGAITLSIVVAGFVGLLWVLNQRK